MLIASALICYISNLSAMPAIIIDWRNKSLLWWYACIDFASDASSFLLNRLHMPKAWISNIFFVCEFVIVGAYLTKAIFIGRMRRGATVGIAVLAVYFIIHTIIISPLEGNYVDGAILYAVFTIFCMLALRRVIQDIELLKIEHSELFTFSAAFLLYASGAMLILLFKQYLNENYTALINQIWSILCVLNILKNLAIARVLFIRKNQSAIRA